MNLWYYIREYIIDPLFLAIQIIGVVIAFPFICLFYYFSDCFCCCCGSNNTHSGEPNLPFEIDYPYYNVPCFTKCELDETFPPQKYSDVKKLLPLANTFRYTSSPLQQQALPTISAQPSTESFKDITNTSINNTENTADNGNNSEQSTDNNNNAENNSNHTQRNSVLSNSTLITLPEKAHIRNGSGRSFCSSSTGCLTHNVSDHIEIPQINNDNTPTANNNGNITKHIRTSSSTDPLYWLDLEYGSYNPENPDLITPTLSRTESMLRSFISTFNNVSTNGEDSTIKPDSLNNTELNGKSSTKTSDRNTEDEENKPCCAICQEDFEGKSGESDAIVRVLPCHHIFHDECITPWICTCKATCPMCQLDLTSNRNLIEHLL
ncbi:uncharacterized protein SAPINGB_P001479 [Magnusiomyces paraingens]|uniref:RING-type domain-containing protein n=1 Tax=Magnusiomyces paraingens TaxID=2606893 RepID=A0A5E8B825_9ASCO|nr:uncharacterized protein SAPINGB_P001479 [Saprochaete ingens]VVT46972.1 unnamed protein product [Saprochaete ingens]